MLLKLTVYVYALAKNRENSNWVLSSCLETASSSRAHNLSPCLGEGGQAAAVAPVSWLQPTPQLSLLLPFNCFPSSLPPSFPSSFPSFFPSLFPSFLAGCLPACLHLFIHGNTWFGFVFSVRCWYSWPWKALTLQLDKLCLNHSLFKFTACLISWFLALWIFCFV